MSDSDWRLRLQAAVDASGKSKRAISLASKNGPGYLHSILSEGKEPTVEKLMAVCDAIPISSVYIMFGVNVNKGDLDILKALEQSPQNREGILAILRAKAG